MLQPKQLAALTDIDVRVAIRLLLGAESTDRTLAAKFERYVAARLGLTGPLGAWVRANERELRDVIDHLDRSQPAFTASDHLQILRRQAESREERDLDEIASPDPRGRVSDEVAAQERARRNPPSDGSVIPMLANSPLGSVEQTIGPFATRYGGTKTVYCVSSPERFSFMLRSTFWTFSLVDIDFVDHDRLGGRMPDPYVRQDLVDVLKVLPQNADDRPVFVVLKDANDISSHLRLAESRRVYPDLVGALASVDELQEAVAAASDRQWPSERGAYWGGLTPDRLKLLDKFIDWLEGSNGSSRLGRHFLVAAAAGHISLDAVTQALDISYYTARNNSVKVASHVAPVFGVVGNRMHFGAVASGAHAFSPWLWTWARRNRALFEPGFLDRMRAQAFGASRGVRQTR